MLWLCVSQRVAGKWPELQQGRAGNGVLFLLPLALEYLGPGSPTFLTLPQQNRLGFNTLTELCPQTQGHGRNDYCQLTDRTAQGSSPYSLPWPPKLPICSWCCPCEVPCPPGCMSPVWCWGRCPGQSSSVLWPPLPQLGLVSTCLLCHSVSDQVAAAYNQPQDSQRSPPCTCSSGWSGRELEPPCLCPYRRTVPS